MRTVRDVGPVQSRGALRISTVSKGGCPADCSGKLTHRSHMRTMGIPWSISCSSYTFQKQRLLACMRTNHQHSVLTGFIR